MRPLLRSWRCSKTRFSQSKKRRWSQRRSISEGGIARIISDKLYTICFFVVLRVPGNRKTKVELAYEQSTQINHYSKLGGWTKAKSARYEFQNQGLRSNILLIYKPGILYSNCKHTALLSMKQQTYGVQHRQVCSSPFHKCRPSSNLFEFIFALRF